MAQPRRTFEIMARSKRRNPASGATAAVAAQAPPGDPSPPDGGAPPDEPAPVKCLCGDEHTGTYAPHWAAVEYTRLVEVFCDDSMRDAVGRLGSGRTREAIDANVEDPFVAMARLFNSASFKPDYMVSAVECATMEPGNVRFHHTRSPEKLKEKYRELKKNLSVVMGATTRRAARTNPTRPRPTSRTMWPCCTAGSDLTPSTCSTTSGPGVCPATSAQRMAVLLPTTRRQTRTRGRRRYVRRRRRNAGAATRRARRPGARGDACPARARRDARGDVRPDVPGGDGESAAQSSGGASA